MQTDAPDNLDPDDGGGGQTSPSSDSFSRFTKKILPWISPVLYTIAIFVAVAIGAVGQENSIRQIALSRSLNYLSSQAEALTDLLSEFRAIEREVTRLGELAPQENQADLIARAETQNVLIDITNKVEIIHLNVSLNLPIETDLAEPDRLKYRKGKKTLEEGFTQLIDGFNFLSICLHGPLDGQTGRPAKLCSANIEKWKRRPEGNHFVVLLHALAEIRKTRIHRQSIWRWFLGQLA